MQRRRQLRSDDNDESDTALHRESRVETAGHLQILLRDKRRVLPVRRADLFHEVWILDLRRIHGEKPPGGVSEMSGFPFFGKIIFRGGGDGHRQSSHTSRSIEHPQLSLLYKLIYVGRGPS